MFFEAPDNLNAQFKITEDYIETIHHCATEIIGKEKIMIEKTQLTMSFNGDTVMDFEEYSIDSIYSIGISFYSADSICRVNYSIGPEDSFLQLNNGYLLKLHDKKYPRYIYFLNYKILLLPEIEEVYKNNINDSYVRRGLNIYFSNNPLL